MLGCLEVKSEKGKVKGARHRAQGKKKKVRVTWQWLPVEQG
jgi:hypothetical protein